MRARGSVVIVMAHRPSAIAAVNKVIGEIAEETGEDAPPEILVVNKVDAADPVVLAQLRVALPEAVFVSAHSRAGIDELLERAAERSPHGTAILEPGLQYTNPIDFVSLALALVLGTAGLTATERAITAPVAIANFTGS